MTPKITIIITAVFNPEQMSAAQEYMQRALPMLVNGGGEIIRRVKVERAVVGEQSYNACLVMDFPSASVIDAIFNSDEYAEIVPLRETGFKSVNIVIASSM